jgi:hypothetical protein
MAGILLLKLPKSPSEVCIESRKQKQMLDRHCFDMLKYPCKGFLAKRSLKKSERKFYL